MNAQDTTELKIKHSDYSFNKQPKKKNKWITPVSVGIGYAATTYTCYRFWDTEIKKFSQEHRSKFQTFISKSVSYLGLGKSQTIGLCGTTILAFAVKDEKLKKATIIWAGSLLINSITTNQLKKAFHRHRPNSGDAYNTFDWRNRSKINISLPSAHTSNMFTTATVFATLYNDKKWVAPVAYALASLVGLSRIYDNAHWGSDILAGAAVGFLSAKAMNSLYSLAGKKIIFLPRTDLRYFAFEVVYQF
ncbi:MAG: phosphatase PAP2 family protein [Chitinophagaceae bacterium]